MGHALPKGPPPMTNMQVARAGYISGKLTLAAFEDRVDKLLERGEADTIAVPPPPRKPIDAARSARPPRPHWPTVTVRD